MLRVVLGGTGRIGERSGVARAGSVGLRVRRNGCAVVVLGVRRVAEVHQQVVLDRFGAVRGRIGGAVLDEGDTAAPRQAGDSVDEVADPCDPG